MDILLLDALVPEAVDWLGARHSVAYRPELAEDMVALRQAAYKTQAIVLPRQTIMTRELLGFLPMLKAIGRLSAGSDSTSLEACTGRGVTVIQASSAHVRSNAEYLLSSLLLLYRRGVVSALMGRRHSVSQMGRELHGSTVGLLGLSPTAHTLAAMLAALGVRVIGYDPAVHHTATIWSRLKVQPVSLAELTSQSDAISVQMLYAARFKGLVNDKLLANCKRNQLWVGISRSELFERSALAAALCDGRIEACILDGAESTLLGGESPLKGLKNLFVTPRLGSHTREARLRSSWYVAHRLHEAITQPVNSDAGPLSLNSKPNELDAPAPAPYEGEGFNREMLAG